MLFHALPVDVVLELVSVRWRRSRRAELAWQHPCSRYKIAAEPIRSTLQCECAPIASGRRSVPRVA